MESPHGAMVILALSGGLMSELHQRWGVPVFLEEVGITGRGDKKATSTDQSAHLLPWERETSCSLLSAVYHGCAKLHRRLPCHSGLLILCQYRREVN